MTKRSKIKISLSPVFLIGSSCTSLLLVSCSIGVSGKSNFGFTQTKFPIYAYSGAPVQTDAPAFTAFKITDKLLNSSTIDPSALEPLTSLSDTVKLAAFSDSKCTKAASGELEVATNPVALESGVASFSDVSVTITSGKEETIYFGGTLINYNLTYCSSFALPILQHFNLGQGYVTFGTTGAAGANTAASVFDAGAAHRVDSSGNYVIAGTSKNTGGGQEMALWRYKPNGALDTTFGGGAGYIHSGTTGVAGATGAAELETVIDLQIDSSGKYIVLGTSANTSAGETELALWKYGSTGAIETTFAGAGAGKYHTGSPGLTGRAAVNDHPKAMQLDADGNIIVVGTSQNASDGYELFVARFTSSGVLDSTFGTAGVYHHPGSPGAAGAAGAAENDIGYSIRIDSNGNYVIAGSSVDLGGGTELAIWRLSKTGVLDSSFGTSGTGIVTSGTTGAAGGTAGNLADIGRSLQIDTTGNYIIAGSSKNSNGGTELALWKYSSSGNLDSTFAKTDTSTGYLHYGATGGAAGATGASQLDVGVSLAIDSLNQKKGYIVTGPSANAAGGKQVAVWKYTFDGTLDTTFNTTGTVVTSSEGAAGSMADATVNDSSASIQVDSVGTYTVVGTSINSSGGKELTIWRYLMTGTLNL